MKQLKIKNMKKIYGFFLGLYIGLKLKKSKEEKTKFVEDWIKNHEFEWNRIKEKMPVTDDTELDKKYVIINTYIILERRAK